MTAVDRAESAVPARREIPDTGAHNVVRALENLGCRAAFGIPGGAVMPVYDALLTSSVRHVLVRHEQGAGHAANGYAQATGETGVCLATSGPGATNLVPPLADAYRDSVPVVAVTGQVARPLMGTDAFQEADIVALTAPVTKHGYLVTDPADIPRVLAEAFHLAGTGRPGPVVVDIPKDVQQAHVPFRWPPRLSLRGYHPVRRPSGKQIAAAASLIRAARRPVLYAGGGLVRSGAHAELRELAERTGMPVVTTLMARGAFPASHPQHGGTGVLRRADLVVALGARIGETGAKVVHVDIDPAGISGLRPGDVPIVGDCRQVLAGLLAALDGTPEPEEWWRELTWAGRPPANGVLARLGELAGPDAVYVAGEGRHRLRAARSLPHERPRSWIVSGGQGAAGFAVPAAMGAQAGLPDRPVWTIEGDLGAAAQELATCALEGLPVKVALLGSGGLPDAVLLAESLGCAGLRCESPAEVDDTVRRAVAITERPVVVDFALTR
ncbi:acetolactate synthase-1/2/3 large subunit [Amycolatopsis bartoniae]|uniref:Acetolactate synthase n=1 Tax=Amycolatopsis bartoniae TaxID=941986 RepID=A0A8H9IRB7_9PSEU|nr:acetolactate synthase-1/2/3 large subunit [Amycolatopsis bartoniae]GHF41702.1 acetolactate synthase [Amycolatopsis bartoniae]